MREVRSTVSLTTLPSINTITSAREKWANPVELTMSSIAMSIGLGNMWRFPFEAYENGGGIFLIPYIIVLFVVARPLYFLEMALGQFTSMSNIRLFHSMAPGIAGIGCSQIISCLCVMSYYSAIVAYAVFYFVHSFDSVLPWTYCRDEWEGACVALADINSTRVANMSSSVELYFTNYVLRSKSDISDGIGPIDGRLTLCLVVTWIVTSSVLISGVESAGKASYFLALFPYVVMIIMLIRAVTLEGAGQGVKLFLYPTWSKIVDLKIWYNAVSQCFFSLGIGFGVIPLFASYNTFETNISTVVNIVFIVDFLTSIMCGITVFAVIGHLAHDMNTTMDKVIKSGMSLAFISYPHVLATIPLPYLFSIIFFLMLFVLGIGSLVPSQQMLVANIHDFLPHLQKQWPLTIATSIIGLVTSLLYTTPGGQHMMQLVDQFGAVHVIYIVGWVEIMATCYIYGLHNICWDIEFMTHHRIFPLSRICWAVLAPILLTIVLICNMATTKLLERDGIVMPTSAQVSGWCLYLFTVLLIPGAFIVCLIQNRKLGKQGMINKTITNQEFGPMEIGDRNAWDKYKARLTRRYQQSPYTTPQKFLRTLFRKRLA